MWRLIYGVPSWLLYIGFVFLPLCLLGWILIPIAAACGAYKAEPDGEGDIVAHFTWPFMFLWDNVEDGIADDSYADFSSMFGKIVYWSAVRNPVNNLRVTKYLTCKIDPTKVGFHGSFANEPGSIRSEIEKYDTRIPQWFVCWCGFYTTWYWQFNFRGSLYRLWLGWKIYPTDILGPPTTSYRKDGSGFALQFNKVA